MILKVLSHLKDSVALLPTHVARGVMRGLAQLAVLWNTDAWLQPLNVWRKWKPLLHVRKLSVLLADKEQLAQDLRLSGDAQTPPFRAATVSAGRHAGHGAAGTPAWTPAVRCSTRTRRPEEGFPLPASPQHLHAAQGRITSLPLQDTTEFFSFLDAIWFSPKRKLRLWAVHFPALSINQLLFLILLSLMLGEVKAEEGRYPIDVIWKGWGK